MLDQTLLTPSGCTAGGSLRPVIPMASDPLPHEIAEAFKRHGFGNLTGAVESLGGRYSHGQLRVYRAAAQTSAA